MDRNELARLIDARLKRLESEKDTGKIIKSLKEFNKEFKNKSDEMHKK